MPLIYCTKCGHRLSTTAPRCPGCGAPPFAPTYSTPEPTPKRPQQGQYSAQQEQSFTTIDAAARRQSEGKKKKAAAGAITGLIFAIAWFWYFFGGGLEKQSDENLQRIENKVAADAVKEYEIAKRNGSPMDACVQAGLVVAAYLQAKDEADYQRWQAIKDADCAAAGLPESENAPAAASDVAADFKLEDLTGQTVSLSSFKGKVIFLNVWATWCEPCRQEMLSMETLYD